MTAPKLNSMSAQWQRILFFVAFLLPLLAPLCIAHQAPSTGEPRLLVVSNRLPVTLEYKEESGNWKYGLSSGGLVSGLSGLKNEMPFLWIGWPGQEIPKRSHELVQSELYNEYNALPVYIDDDTANKHYNGFSNRVLWPYFHDFPLLFDVETWDAYQRVNKAFADTICDIVNDGDLVWIHDYHLMLLPALLRERMAIAKKNIKIGFFLHTPFPSSHLYKQHLPVWKTLLLGVFQSDLIGFQTDGYARNFLNAFKHRDPKPNRILPNSAKVNPKVGVYPIGIDTEKFSKALKSDTVRAHIAQFQNDYAGRKIILGVDRMDYIKGLPQKLEAFEMFLDENTEYIDKVVLVQIAVPSRTDVKEYQQLATTVQGLVERINNKFAPRTENPQDQKKLPIHYLHCNVAFDKLCAWYAVADACLVTSTRDGMNLVSFEYIACQQENHGVMVLSEFAGAATCLNGCINVNPHKPEKIANAIRDALVMKSETRERNHKKLYGYVSKNTAAFWGLTFVNDLKNIGKHESVVEKLKRLRVPRGGSAQRISWKQYVERRKMDPKRV